MPVPERRSYTVGVLALQGAFLEHINLLKRLRLPRGHEIDVIAVRTEEDLKSCDAMVLPGGESTAMAAIAKRSQLLEPLQAFCQDPCKPCFGTCAGMIMLASKAEGAKKGGQDLFGGMDTVVLRNGYGGQMESFESPLLLTLDVPESTPSPPSKSSPLNPSTSNDAAAASTTPHVSEDTISELPLPLPIFVKKPALNTRSSSYLSETPFNGIFIRAPMLLSPPEPSSPSSESSLNVLARLPFLPSSLPEHAHSDVVAYSIGKKMCASFHPELSGDERFHEWFVRVLCVRD